MPLSVNIGIVVGILGVALPMVGVGGPALGWSLIGLSLVLIVIGAVPRGWSWIRRDTEIRGLRIALSEAERRREELRLEIEQLKERLEQPQSLENHRRKRIEEWRSVIRNFDFKAERFGATDTYSQMRQHLQGQIAHMFEGNSTVYLVNDARGRDLIRYKLLDEVARIEKEWGLI
jgi:hypothetical protein